MPHEWEHESVSAWRFSRTVVRDAVARERRLLRSVAAVMAHVGSGGRCGAGMWWCVVSSLRAGGGRRGGREQRLARAA
jgi:hypothetical protein